MIFSYEIKLLSYCKTTKSPHISLFAIRLPSINNCDGIRSEMSRAEGGLRSIDRRGRMVRGTLEVLLVGAKGLEDTDFLSNMDPYAILICCTQEQRSSTASGKGSDPEWNETFVFSVSDDVPELAIKLMDSDAISDDDFVGEAKIPLEPLFLERRIPPTMYNVVKDEEYCGEIKLGLTFIPEENHGGYNEDNYGGWRESS